jgi:hypothetical protein
MSETLQWNILPTWKLLLLLHYTIAIMSKQTASPIFDSAANSFPSATINFIKKMSIPSYEAFSLALFHSCVSF